MAVAYFDHVRNEAVICGRAADTLEFQSLEIAFQSSRIDRLYKALEDIYASGSIRDAERIAAKALGKSEPPKEG